MPETSDADWSILFTRVEAAGAGVGRWYALPCSACLGTVVLDRDDVVVFCEECLARARETRGYDVGGGD